MSIKPALTAEEWAKKETKQAEWCYNEGAVKLGTWIVWEGDTERELEVLIVYGESDFRYPIADRHGTAALCLHGQTYGFTWEDVETLREIAEVSQFPREVHICASLANRIEALLPPDEVA